MSFAHSDQAKAATSQIGSISGEVRSRPKLEGGRPFVLESEFSPAGDQPTAIKELVAGIGDGDRDQVLLGATGTGKTFTIAKVIEETQRPALILAPLRVAQSVWPEEVQKWKHLNNLSVSVICGNVKQRQAALKVKADIYTINYENIVWLIKELKAHPVRGRKVANDQHMNAREQQHLADKKAAEQSFQAPRHQRIGACDADAVSEQVE